MGWAGLGWVGWRLGGERLDLTAEIGDGGTIFLELTLGGVQLALHLIDARGHGLRAGLVLRGLTLSCLFHANMLLGHVRI